MADIFNDPRYAARGTIAHVPDGDGDPITMPAPVPSLSDTPAVIRHAACSIGADTTGALRELAGIGGCMRPA
jgi:crotonobetainyl-CoA:carnitine CoA-transferase CaiB-like acyl-CoA transferase